MFGISTIWTIVQGPLHSRSLHDSHFSSPLFCLLYLLPLCSYPNLYSSSGIPSLVLFILNPSLPSSFPPSFSHVLILSYCHPPVPLCVWSPLEAKLHCHKELVTQKHIYPRTQLFHEPSMQNSEQVPFCNITWMGKMYYGFCNISSCYTIQIEIKCERSFITYRIQLPYQLRNPILHRCSSVPSSILH